MTSIKSFLALAAGAILVATGLFLLWLSFKAPEWGAVSLLTGIGMLLIGAPCIPWLRERIARPARMLPTAATALGLVLVGATTAALIALGVGENRRIAARNDAAPGVIASIRPAALLGVGEAAHHLGLAHFLGQDGPQDLFAARYWTMRAAQAGNAGAQLDLARMYARGLGGPADGKLALAWAEKAAAQGISAAYTTIGTLYSPGGALPEDHQKANAAFMKGSDLGEPEAMFNLGLAYEYGTGVTKDPGRAFQLYLAAAELGLPDAKLNVGVAYMNGQGVTADLRKAQMWLEASKARASAEVRKLANQNLAILEEQ
ncbi:MAG: hypothetical protein B7Y36_00445 [Novosphingobium sp. 28-62-57]|uniref:tetratricopeptide repeat protein n=1 Tax=Novosphingobium sp. TaxID=1874826 RepID=UPI000BCAEA72|nr:tetratricopeptide repeat protein [Novosphingobium sp.]OYW48781.1 MAG: hypothetical protein B7Z34_11960 [Novosphingobium sp. 12-62-10]OYZ12063.1 MAG: hypothetical protein B7Y36_00445 [Novosphingobium sp. 28-62-57]